ncbi:hypothetical protein E2C01_078684 [Portunus trituberculatus]|uniref:Uncharacterized protein n=1 Tax=Portunus trituberculatus TaxID=210409 RepID=A0A5B7IEZ5_PORTR|nr:hypothetical protein [Portunus trituberculatus]
MIERLPTKGGATGKGKQNIKKKAQGVASSLKIQVSYPKFRDKCRETSLLKEVKSQEEGNK